MMNFKMRLFPYFGGISRETGRTPQTIKGPSDHIHLLAQTEEFISFLRKHGIEYDERYIWKWRNSFTRRGG
jgi:hypothetical protein